MSSRRAQRRSVLWLAGLVLAAATDAPAAPPVRPPVEPGTAAPGGPRSRDEGKDPGPRSQPRALRVPHDAALEAALLEAEADTDVTHYALEIEVIPETTGNTVTAVRVEGVSTIDLEPTVDGLTSFTVDLHSALTVNAVTGDVASWSRVGHTVEITLDGAYDTGEPIQVAVDYAGYPQTAGYGAFRWWERNGELVVATLSEPFYARYWWPCKDALDDKATLQMNVTVPSQYLALSNGVEVGSQAVAGGRTRYLWHETHPMIPYLASLAIASYERYDLQYDYDDGGVPASMPVPCFVYPDHWDGGAGQPLPAYKAGCDELPDMLETFSALFGPYPWLDEKYGVVETGGTGGLAASMEHQTLSSMARVDDFTHIMAHELAHQWWGDEVTCETWYDIWLNEAFASYAEPLYFEYGSGGSAAAYWNRMNQRRPPNPDGQVYRTSIGSTGAIFSGNDVYNKGAWVLHMLRHVVGDAAFLAALADYRAAYADDSATTDEFAAVLSASFGDDLAWFVDQWVLGPGSPDYEWNYASDEVAGQHLLELAVWQVQDLDGFGLFTMPIDVRVTTASGTQVHTIWNDDWEEYYVLPVDGPVLAVEFDEDGGIADRNWVLWDSRAQVATALAPPPVLVSADVALPALPAGTTTVTLVFSQDVGSFDAADLVLTGTTTGAHAPASVVYDAASHTATASFAGLAPDDYVLQVLDAGVFANGKALDGEVDDAAWWDAQLLPSGDGQPGGDAAIAFSVGTGSASVPGAGAGGRTLLALLLAGAARIALRRRAASSQRPPGPVISSR